MPERRFPAGCTEAHPRLDPGTRLRRADHRPACHGRRGADRPRQSARDDRQRGPQRAQAGIAGGNRISAQDGAAPLASGLPHLRTGSPVAFRPHSSGQIRLLSRDRISARSREAGPDVPHPARRSVRARPPRRDVRPGLRQRRPRAGRVSAGCDPGTRSHLGSRWLFPLGGALRSQPVAHRGRHGRRFILLRVRMGSA